MKQNQPPTPKWEWLGYAIPGELVLFLLPVILGVWGIACLVRGITYFLENNPLRQTVALLALALVADLAAVRWHLAMGYGVSILLSILAWSRWRSKQET